jgi:hypothetical protein
MTDKAKRPRDANQLAKFIVDHATMDEAELEELRERLRKAQSPGNVGSDSERKTSGNL